MREPVRVYTSSAQHEKRRFASQTGYWLRSELTRLYFRAASRHLFWLASINVPIDYWHRRRRAAPGLPSF